MKITKKQLRRIIREAKQNFLAENASRYADGDLVEDFGTAVDRLFENTFWVALKDVKDVNEALRIAKQVAIDQVNGFADFFGTDLYERFGDDIVEKYLAGEANWVLEP